MELNEGLVYTKDNCIGCNRCISGCPVLGAKLIYDVSYGADIATWAYLTYLKENTLEGAIAPPCSAVVNYIEKYSRELVKKLIPVQSPLMCLAIYVRRYLKETDRLAFISPCIAKKMK